jgi:ADP-heptose:LPS heptosyltransferase
MRALVYCAGGGIGDSLMASIVAEALKQRYETVDALTLPAHGPALERVPVFDAVLNDDGSDERALAEFLAQRAYDAAIVTWATPHTARVPQLAKIPVRVGQANRLYSWRFTQRVAVRSEQGDVTSHWSDILLDYARALDVVPPERPVLHFEPSLEDERAADELCAQLGLTANGFALVHPANAIASERGIWPLEGWANLVREISARFNLPVLVTGSEDDRDIAEGVVARGGGFSLAGKTTIGSFGSLARRGAFFAGVTTGAMHVAAACGAPTVGIYPFQTDTPDRWAPLGARTAIVRATYPCRPGERKETCPDYACIANLDVPRIMAAIESLTGAPAAA